LKCPKCATEAAEGRVQCVRCGHPLGEDAHPHRTTALRAANTIMWTAFVLISALVLALAFYRLYFWFDAWRLGRIYETGRMMAPDIEEITLDDGRIGHAVTFYGDDGNSIFIKELGKSFLLSGGLTRIEIADSSWFAENPEDAEAAIITMTPVIEGENGGRSELPPLEMTVAVPDSPLNLISPSQEFEQVVNSIHSLQIQVVPGSTVLVNGEDVTDVVDYAGQLSANINIGYGENNISILVATPNHRQTRRDIVLYRQPQDIPLEPSLNLPKSSSTETVSIFGTIDPSAALVIDTPYVEDSIQIDQSGSFSFKAKLTQIGDNEVTFRAQKPGLADSAVTVKVSYVPSLNEYSRKAWKMDWEGLLLSYRGWIGQEFLCRGPLVEIIEGETQLLVINVGTEEAPKHVILDNLSSETSPAVGSTYRAYADVAGEGNYFYNDVYCPRLTARYLLIVED
jgi:hypothetical protein